MIFLCIFGPKARNEKWTICFGMKEEEKENSLFIVDNNLVIRWGREIKGVTRNFCLFLSLSLSYTNYHTLTHSHTHTHTHTQSHTYTIHKLTHTNTLSHTRTHTHTHSHTHYTHTHTRTRKCNLRKQREDKDKRQNLIRTVVSNRFQGFGNCLAQFP